MVEASGVAGAKGEVIHEWREGGDSRRKESGEVRGKFKKKGQFFAKIGL